MIKDLKKVSNVYPELLGLDEIKGLIEVESINYE